MRERRAAVRPAGRTARRWWRPLAVVAAGCGGDDEGGAGWQIEGLGSSIEEIQERAREEGQVNLVTGRGTPTSRGPTSSRSRRAARSNTKDGATSDDMITLLRRASTTASRRPATRASA